MPYEEKNPSVVARRQASFGDRPGVRILAPLTLPRIKQGTCHQQTIKKNAALTGIVLGMLRQARLIDVNS
jgi:hypothetical protein